MRTVLNKAIALKNNIYNKAGAKCKTFFLQKKEGNEQLIVALVMIAIAVALVLIFKDKISTLMTSFMNNVTTKINNALGV